MDLKIYKLLDLECKVKKTMLFNLKSNNYGFSFTYDI